jgi:hypothetical protein
MKHLTRQPDKGVGTIPAAFWKGMGSRTVLTVFWVWDFMERPSV